MLLFLLSLFGYLCAIMIAKWLLYPCQNCDSKDLMNWANYYQCSPNLLIGKFLYFQMSTFVTFNLIMSTASLYIIFFCSFVYVLQCSNCWEYRGFGPPTSWPSSAPPLPSTPANKIQGRSCLSPPFLFGQFEHWYLCWMCSFWLNSGWGRKYWLYFGITSTCFKKASSSKYLSNNNNNIIIIIIRVQCLNEQCH